VTPDESNSASKSLCQCGLRFAGAVALVALAGTIVWIAWPRSRQVEVADSFRLDLAPLKQVDAALMMGRERASVPVPVTGPNALAVDSANRIYVGGDSAIVVLEPDGRLIRRLPVEQAVSCLAVGKEGELVVGYRDRIVVLAADGAVKTGWAPPGSNAVLTSVAVTGEDIFVADAGQRLVWRFGSDGRLLGRIGAKDPARDMPGFVIPSPYFDLAIGPGGALWVVDPGQHKLIHFSPDGDPLSSWQREGEDIEGFSGCCNPSHIAIRADGSFVTSEKGLVRIKIHAATGALVGVLATPAHFDSDTRGIDLAVDGNGRILALDPDKGVILVFETEDP
jgi:sugar lactone lactonase YvrE